MEIIVLAVLFTITSIVCALQYCTRKIIGGFMDLVLGTMAKKCRFTRKRYLITKACILLNFWCSLYLVIAIASMSVYVIAFFPYEISACYSFVLILLLNVALLMAAKRAVSDYGLLPVMKSFHFETAMPATKDKLEKPSASTCKLVE